MHQTPLRPWCVQTTRRESPAIARRAFTRNAVPDKLPMSSNRRISTVSAVCRLERKSNRLAACPESLNVFSTLYPFSGKLQQRHLVQPFLVVGGEIVLDPFTRLDKTSLESFGGAAAEYRGWGDRKSFPALFFCGQSVVAVAISAPLVPGSQPRPYPHQRPETARVSGSQTSQQSLNRRRVPATTPGRFRAPVAQLERNT